MKTYYCHYLSKGLVCICERDGICEAGRFSRCKWKAEFPKETPQTHPLPTNGSKAVEKKDTYQKGFIDGYVAGTNNFLKEMLKEIK